jgi:thiopurine S-methyltransferase
MDQAFWHDKWERGLLGFHQEKINSRLRKYWPELALPAGSQVFVPLCGKSLDMAWLAGEGHRVLGVELSSIACADFFRANDIEFSQHRRDHFERFSGHDIELWAGDFFALIADDLADVQAVYDRASLVAFPPQMRPEYANQLATLLKSGVQILLISMEYDQDKMKGPPFSVPQAEVRALFERHFDIEVLSESSGPEIVGNLSDRGLDTLTERVYRLTRK